MSSCIPVCTRLLGSKVNTDVLESLEFLATAVEFKVQGSREGVRKALALVWSKEQQIKDNLVQVYLRLYIQTEVRRSSGRLQNSFFRAPLPSPPFPSLSLSLSSCLFH